MTVIDIELLAVILGALMIIFGGVLLGVDSFLTGANKKIHYSALILLTAGAALTLISSVIIFISMFQFLAS